MGAAWQGHTDVVGTLLADTVTDDLSDDPFSDVPVVKRLTGANVNAHNNLGLTALMGAALGGYTDTVKMLLDAGADVNAKDNRGFTALIGAASEGYANIVKMLLNAGADVNAEDDHNDALMEAIESAHTGTVEILLAAGADKDTRSKYGHTALRIYFKTRGSGLVRTSSGTRAGRRPA